MSDRRWVKRSVMLCGRRSGLLLQCTLDLDQLGKGNVGTILQGSRAGNRADVPPISSFPTSLPAPSTALPRVCYHSHTVISTMQMKILR